MKPGRNDPCPCGSGKKYKHCCLGKIIPFSSDPVDPDSMEMRDYFKSGVVERDILDEMDEYVHEMDDEYYEYDDEDEGRSILREQTLEVVDNQIRENNPKETRLTFERLKREGFSEQEAKELIGTVVSTEIFELIKKKEFFNEERYVSRLKKLPDLGFLDE